MLNERVEFPNSKQKEFILEAKLLSKAPWRKSEEYFGIKYNTFRSYYKENTRISFQDFKKICKKLSLDFNKIIRKYGAKIIGWAPESNLKNVVKFGQNRTVFSDKNIKFEAKKNLDLRKISYSKKDLEKKIVLPTTISEELAEEIGMHLGDGFLSEKKYEYRLKGDKKEEKEYYEKKVKSLFKKLYNIDLKLKEFETTYGFELYSQAIWDFKTKTIGIPAGKKTNIKIPEIVKTSDEKILAGVVRGFFDTDGCIYFRSQNKHQKYYPVISAASKSKKLLDDFNEILRMLGFFPKLYINRGVYSIVLNGYANFKKYYESIGWSSPKHLRKINDWIKKNQEIARKYNLKLVAVV